VNSAYLENVPENIPENIPLCLARRTASVFSQEFIASGLVISRAKVNFSRM